MFGRGAALALATGPGLRGEAGGRTAVQRKVVGVRCSGSLGRAFRYSVLPVRNHDSFLAVLHAPSYTIPQHSGFLTKSQPLQFVGKNLGSRTRMPYSAMERAGSSDKSSEPILCWTFFALMPAVQLSFWA